MILAIISLGLAREEKSAQTFVDHTYQVIVATEEMLGDVQSAEIAGRGYRVTGNPSYTIRMHVALTAAFSDRDRFEALTPDNPHQQARASQLKAELSDLALLIRQGMVAPGPGGQQATNATRALVASTVAKVDQIRSVLGAASAEERGLLALRKSHTRKLEHSTLVLVILSMTLAVIILAGSVVLLTRSNLSLSRSEAVRARQATILQTTLDSIRDGIAVFDSDGRLAACNANFFNLTKLPLSLALEGTHLREFQATEKERPTKLFPPDTNDEASTPDVRRLTLADRHLDVYSAGVPNGGRLLAVVDVTSRVRSEETLRQAQKMEAVGQLTGGIAHDFNNLLQIISANLDLASDAEGLGSRVSTRINNAIAAVERGARLTTQLLAFARRQPLEPRAINLGRLVRDMADMLRRTLGERIEVETAMGAGLWNTMADPNQLQNALLNLTINARDAMPDGGKLTIEVANTFLDDDYVAQHAEVAAGQYVMLAVTDTGSGMAPNVLSRAFDPFFTTKPEGQGTGLGLSQVYGFVKQSGGHVKIYSEIGEGTTVKLYLPRTRKAQEVAPEPVDLAMMDGHETILVVEDDEEVRAAVADILTELGYSVLEAEDAEKALDILKGKRKIDLLFSDVVMPGTVPTREMARLAQEIVPDIKILFTSGYTQNAIVHNGRLDEGVFLLSKPYRKHELARKLRTLLQATERAPQEMPAPAAEAPIVAADTKSDALQNGNRPKKALIVDDVALVRMTTVDIVGEIGIRAEEAGTGPEALDILRNDGDIDLLVTDLGLPGMSGAELIQRARENRPELAVVVISGYSRDSEPHNGVPADVKFVAKPFTSDQLRRAILGA